MERDRNYFIDRITICQKVIHQLEQEIRLLNEQVKSSSLLLAEINDEIEFVKDEENNLRRQILKETIQLENEAASKARLEYITKTKLDQINELKYELGDLIQAREKKDLTFATIDKLKNERRNLQEALDLRQKQQESITLDGLHEAIRRHKMNLQGELKELQKRLKKIL